ncbi:MAG: hypothetical protein GXO83_01095 [Chlorobi bacterium]|nr:hypothetical protein [Chlorobiota bacterium]
MSAVKTYFVTRSTGYYRNLFIIFLLLILSVSSIPSLPDPDITTPYFKIRTDYFFHLGEYFILVFLGISWWHKKETFSLIYIVIMMMAIGIIIGTGDEFHQKLIPGRTFNPFDAVSNISGSLLGSIAGYFFWRSALIHSSKQDIDSKDES